MAVPISKDEVTCLVLDFLKQHGFAQAQRSLEAESGLQLEISGRETNYVKGLILDGLWSDVENFIAPLKLRKQQYLECLASQQLSRALVILVDQLKPLEASATRAEFAMLCYCITLPRLSDHPDFRRWSPASGRAACWAAMQPFFEVIYGPAQPDRMHSVPPNRLMALLRHSLSKCANELGYRDTAQLSLLSDELLTDAREGKVVVTEPPEPYGLAQTRPQKASEQQKYLPEPEATSKPGTSNAVMEHPQFSQRSSSRQTSEQHRYWKCAATVREGHTLRTVAFHPSGNAFAFAGNSGHVYTSVLDDALDGNTVRPLAHSSPRTTHKGSVYCLGWHGNLLASGSNDRSVHLSFISPSEPSSQPILANFQGHSATVKSLTFSDTEGRTDRRGRETNGLVLISGCADGSVSQWDVSTATLMGRLKAHEGNIVHVHMSNTSQTLFTCAEESIKLWDLRSQKCVWSCDTSAPAVAAAIEWSSHTVAVALDDPRNVIESGSVALYDVRQSQQTLLARPHSAKCVSLNFSPDGQWIGSGGFDGLVCITRTADGASTELAVHGSGKVTSVAWHPGQQGIVSSSTEGTVMYWTPQQ